MIRPGREKSAPAISVEIRKSEIISLIRAFYTKHSDKYTRLSFRLLWRVTRAALGLNCALEEIAQNKGVLYDPEAVEACLGLFRKKDCEIKM